MIFLDAIEKRFPELMRVVKEQPAIMNRFIESAKSEMVAVAREISANIEALKFDVPDNSKPVVDALQALHNQQTTSFNRALTEVSKRYETTTTAILEELRKPRNFEMKIDRNFQTKLIQKVTIEQI